MGGNGPAPGVLTAEEVQLDLHGNETRSRRFVDASGQRATRLTQVPGSVTEARSVSVNGLLTESRSPSGVTMSYAYDGH